MSESHHPQEPRNPRPQSMLGTISKLGHQTVTLDSKGNDRTD